MLKIKNLRGECQHCGAPIEFHAESIGTTADCPHCGQPTELLLSTPPDETSPLRTKAIIFSVLAILILVGGLVGANLALKRAKRLKATQTPAEVVAPAAAKPAGPFADQEFQVSSVTLDQGPGSTIVYAIGTIQNLAPRQRFGVKVELELVDEAGVKVGATSDYQKVIEPGAQWNFRALVVAKRVRAARVVAIKEAE